MLGKKIVVTVLVFVVMLYSKDAGSVESEKKHMPSKLDGRLVEALLVAYTDYKDSMLSRMKKNNDMLGLYLSDISNYEVDITNISGNTFIVFLPKDMPDGSSLKGGGGEYLIDEHLNILKRMFYK